jgi:thiol:disulfide interchange protein
MANTEKVALLVLAALASVAMVLLVGCPKQPAATTGGSTTPAETTKAASTPSPGAPTPSASGGAGIAWVTSLDEGLAEAAKQKKPVMVDFYTDWCHWCKELDDKTYSDAAVQDKAKALVCVKVNAEEDKASAEKYNVTGFPTILFLDSSGTKIHEVVGFKPAAEFVTDMDTALGNAK